MAGTARLRRLEAKLATSEKEKETAIKLFNVANDNVERLEREIKKNNDDNDTDNLELQMTIRHLSDIEICKAAIKQAWIDGIVTALSKNQFKILANLTPEMISNDGKIYIKM